METSSHNHCVYGVLVTFHPEPDWQTRLPLILAQVTHLVVVDNSQTEQARTAVQTACQTYHDSITYLPSPRNNLALAQNIGIRHALDKQATHVLLLDDDSTPHEGMVVSLLLHDAADIGLLAPVMRDSASRRQTRYLVAKGALPTLLSPSPHEVLRGVLHVISSGSLIARRSFERAGLMDESFGIDYVDKDFCLKLRQAGLKVCVVGAAVLEHRIGQCRDHSLAGLRITTTNHPPQRRYTIYRNRLFCLRRYGAAVPAFALHELVGIAYDLLRIAAFEENKKEKFKAILRGIKDGLSTPC